MGQRLPSPITLEVEILVAKSDETAGDGIPDASSLITVPEEADYNSDVSAFTIKTSVPTTAGANGAETDPTLITGGRIHPQAGSGTMTMITPSDNQVEAGERIPTITLQYRAATALENVNIWKLM